MASNKPQPVGTRKVRKFRKSSYWMVYRPDHPDAPLKFWMMEHRLVMEAKIGRRILPAEVVHHIDHDSLNNDPSNLALYASKGQHLAIEHSAEGVEARMAGYPICACGKRTAYGSVECWKCWCRSQTCPVCERPDRKMARRDICHGCYKRLRVKEGRYSHGAPKSDC